MSKHPTETKSQRPCVNRICIARGNLVKRFFDKIKRFRRTATRYDKFAANYAAFIKLASVRIWLRVNESTPW
jgi:transposase